MLTTEEADTLVDAMRTADRKAENDHIATMEDAASWNIKGLLYDPFIPTEVDHALITGVVLGLETNTGHHMEEAYYIAYCQCALVMTSMQKNMQHMGKVQWDPQGSRSCFATPTI
jgi:hypothetical protein